MRRTIRLTPNEGAAYLVRSSERMRERLAKAETENATEARLLAVQLSSGQFHSPGAYSRMFRSNVDPSVVNVEFGAFHAGWRQSTPQRDGSGLETRVGNVSREAGFILAPGGTRKMVERPLLDRVTRTIRARVQERRTKAIEEALEP